MPITSQIRLQQLTGSLVAQKPVSLGKQGEMTATGFAAADVNDLFKYYAKAIANIHGDLNVGNQDPGSFSQSIYSDNDQAQDLGVAIASEGTSDSSTVTGPSSIDATTTSLAFSGGLAGSISAGIVKLQKSDGTFMLFNAPSGGGSGATSLSVEYIADGSSLASMAVGDIQSFKTGITVATNEWGVVRSPRIRSAQDMEVEAYGANKKIVLAVNRSSNDGIVLRNSNAAGAIQAEVGGNVALTVHDDRLEASLTTDATGKGSVASLKVLGGLALAKKAFIGDDIALDTDAKQLKLGSTAGTALLIDHLSDRPSAPTRLHQSGSIDLQIGSDQKVRLASANGSSVVSGSAGVAFPVDGGFGFGGSTEGGLLLAQDATLEAADFRAITDAAGVAFGNTTSILAAFKKLNDKVQAGEPTLFKFEAPTGHTPAAAVTVSKVAGDASALATGLPANKLDVYVNGQLMLAGSGKDYNVTASNVITFEFNIEEGDVVMAIDRS